MPPKRKSIGQSTLKAKKVRALRATETEGERRNRLETNRLCNAELRRTETDEQRAERQESDSVRTTVSRASETDEIRDARCETERVRITESRQRGRADLKQCAFNYNANYDYSMHPVVVIGKMDKLCVYCGALRFRN